MTLRSFHSTLGFVLEYPLNRDGRLSALVRRLRRQLLRRAVLGVGVVEFVSGASLRLSISQERKYNP
jgi:hypothetical protein